MVLWLKLIQFSQGNDTYRLAASKANSDVTLEPDVVTAWELESVEAGYETSSVGVIFPFAKDSWI